MNDDLRAFLDGAYDTHAASPQAIAEALAARAPTLPADDEGAEALRLAEHVLLGHLADADALQRLLAALPAGFRDAPGGACADAVGRVRWALARVGDAADLPPIGEPSRWRVLQNVLLAWIATGRGGDASRTLRESEPQAAGSPDTATRQAFAACANNLALHLREGPRGNAARDALMLDAATIARRAWQGAGTWMHVERADYQLARCHAVLGRGDEALAHARSCLAICEAEGADAAERFFAHEALWHAARAAGDADAAGRQRDRMQGLLAEVGDEALRTWCAQVLQDLPAH
ncbi:hypothetical protein [Aquabacterium humicola]|uniref:hypothetical protein n=1 Tax=Aquabacterium humicola TaxID=3237377 RepID=UPI002543AF62|nr:hypothetical protein [Rubrivivax pictus]